MNEQENIKQKNAIHHVLAHSYLVFLFVIIIGVIFDTFLKDKLFTHAVYSYIGFAMLVTSSILIFWAQKTSYNYKNKKLKNGAISHFEHGPYKYLRNPTHLGVFIMTLGFSFMINSFFSVIFTIVAHLLIKIFFLTEEEKILEKKYGQVYLDYKKKVKNWI